jgi:hypothetical protein
MDLSHCLHLSSACLMIMLVFMNLIIVGNCMIWDLFLELHSFMVVPQNQVVRDGDKKGKTPD